MKHARGFIVLASAALLFSTVGNYAMARERPAAQAKQEVQYPNATRAAPKLDLTSEKDQKALNEGLDAVAAGDSAKAQEILQPLIDGGTKSKYAQSLALQGLASLKYNEGDHKAGIELLQRSLALGVMPNDTYFQLMYMLAQFQLGDEQYQPALDTLAKWRAEGKKETAASYALDGNAYYRLGKYAEAITAIDKAKSLTDKADPSWNQILMASYAETGQTDKAAELAQQQLAANPDDPNALNNAASVLIQANKYPDAIAMLEKARAAGMFKSEKNYESLAKLYLITAQDSSEPAANAAKGSQVLQEGIDKGVVKPTSETYMLLGQAAELSDNIPAAIAAYTKALPMDKDGSAAMRAGRLLLTESKFSQAKSMIQQSLDKGVKQKGVAYMILAEAERGLKNKPAAVAAMKMAAQQPETAERAKAWLKKAGAQ